MSGARIAFVVPYGWPALAGRAAGFDYVGGAEMQQARLARVLAARGHDVWLVSADFGQPPRTQVDGVTVERAYRPFGGLPGLRFLHPRLTGTWAALNRVAPDVVYQRTAGALTGICAAWARSRRRGFVFACAHDYDALSESPALGNARDRALYRWGLHRADRVLAQSTMQVEALARHHGIAAAVVRNVVPLPDLARPDEAADTVLWLGTVKPDKRPRWVLEAARALPDVHFTLAGGAPPPPAPDHEFRAVREEARALPNVTVTGFVAPGDVPALVARARVFAHTSAAEGFPNTLLEAWAQGVPSVSAVDPDGMVTGGGAGLLAADPAGFAHGIRRLWDDAAERRRRGQAARAAVEQRHGPEAVAAAFEQALAPWLGAASREVA